MEGWVLWGKIKYFDSAFYDGRVIVLAWNMVAPGQQRGGGQENGVWSETLGALFRLSDLPCFVKWLRIHFIYLTEHLEHPPTHVKFVISQMLT